MMSVGIPVEKGPPNGRNWIEVAEKVSPPPDAFASDRTPLGWAAVVAAQMNRPALTRSDDLTLVLMRYLLLLARGVKRNGQNARTF
jgi:hypothetical protein